MATRFPCQRRSPEQLEQRFLRQIIRKERVASEEAQVAPDVRLVVKAESVRSCCAQRSSTRRGGIASSRPVCLFGHGSLLPPVPQPVLPWEPRAHRRMPHTSDAGRPFRISEHEPTFDGSSAPPDASSEEVAELVEALQSPELEVRYAAAEILMALDLEVERCTEVLREALHGEAESDSQLAANALVRLGSPAVPPLAAGLRDPKISVRQASATGTGRARRGGVRRRGKTWRASLADASANVRATAARALARIGPRARQGAGQALVTAVEDSNPLVRMRAASALISLDHEKGSRRRPVPRGSHR